MKMNKSNLTKYSWAKGFLGFLGFSGFYTFPGMFLFFAFFGAFQYYWWYKIGTEEDERLIEDRNLAGSKAFRFSLAFGFLLSLAISFLEINFEMLYKLQLIIFAVTFALAANLWGYLTYKYDRGEA